MIDEAAHPGDAAGAAVLPLIEATDEAGARVRPVDAWLEHLLCRAVRRYNRRPCPAIIAASTGVTELTDARAVVRRACLRSALAGGATGALATGAAAATAETNGLGGLVAIPAVALAIGGETVLRLLLHVQMLCELADLFGIRFDPDEPADVWALLALTFGVVDLPEDTDDPAGALVHSARERGSDVAKQLAARLVGESMARNLVPVLSVASSSITSWVVTRHLGDTARRYLRYRRALDGALSDEALRPHAERLFEGLWFIFTADGRLKPEETALLAAVLRRLPASACACRNERLADDIAWIERLREVPEGARAPLLRALEVAAAVDKVASLRERKLLAHAAAALGLGVDEGGLDRMIRELEEIGTLCAAA
ncbi:hypothetical protein WMF18_15160 [Sorangium sp. So ce315]|uniref:hypothetical protein n=1 Tax=Sorangium sp. So ce315 TaxID=3133299 RepID=UPI003F6045DC